jgi:hypothetical protein
MIYTPELIKSIAPAVFATSPSSKMTNKYSFVPTDQVMEYFDREGWQLSSIKQSGKDCYGVHELRYRNSELPKVGDTLVEAVIRNSHNGTSAFSMGAGLFRLVCSNGLTVPTSIAESFKLRHNNFSLDDVKELADSFSKKLPMIETSVFKMMKRDLTFDEKRNFVMEAAKIRWAAGSVPSTINIEEILNPLRDEDNGDDLWKIFNVVQEKMIRGGVSYKSARGRSTSLKGIKGIQVSNRLNTKLWEAAELLLV